MISVRHEAGDRFRIDVRGHRIVVDQPPPTSGDAGPTPTELFVASLAGCAAFYARRFLARHGIRDGDLEVRAEPHWAAGHTHVATIDVEVLTPDELDPVLAAGVARTIEHCTVSASIRERPVITVALGRREAREVAATGRGA